MQTTRKFPRTRHLQAGDLPLIAMILITIVALAYAMGVR